MKKFEFISKLLDTQKFNHNQKMRFITLVSKELSKFDNKNSEIIADITAIKERMGMINASFTNKTEKSSFKKLLDDFDENFHDGLRIGNKESDQNDMINLLNSSKYRPKKSLNSLRKLNKKGKGEISDFSSNDSNTLTKYYYPSSSYKFLFNFNQNKILKSTCHDVGSQELQVINNYCSTDTYNFNKHLETIIKEYEVHEDKYFAPSFLKTRFRVYLTGKNYYGELSKGWSEESININWSSPKLKEWSIKNPGVPPNLNDALVDHFENTGFEDFEGFTSNFSGIPIQSFTQLIFHFKHSFHLNGNNSLRSLIERINKQSNWNEQIEFIIDNQSFPFNIEHFTDVEKLIQAYKSIIDLILELTKTYGLEKPKVKLRAKVSLEEFLFSIHHINSIYKKSITSTLERTGQHYRNLIENQVNGLCNLTLRAEFESDEKSQINLWNGKQREAVSIADENFKGVEHIFQFPKK